MIARGLATVLVLVLAACSNADKDRLQGWVEADYVFVGPDEAGRVAQLGVREGDTVAAGAPLFSLDEDLQQADVRTAAAQVAEARARLARLDSAQQRREEIAVLQAQEKRAEAAVARRDAAETRLARRRLAAPVDGAVQQVYYRPGEMVPAGRPVVSILPPGNIKVRFFVGEPLLPTVALGDTVEVTCDGCAKPIPARVSFIARSAEYTPPVIYSLEERNKLVFMVEARPEKPDGLRVGQPVQVALKGGVAEAKK